MLYRRNSSICARMPDRAEFALSVAFALVGKVTYAGKRRIDVVCSAEADTAFFAGPCSSMNGTKHP